jgi:hypothetical protein
MPSGPKRSPGSGTGNASPGSGRSGGGGVEVTVGPTFAQADADTSINQPNRAGPRRATDRKVSDNAGGVNGRWRRRLAVRGRRCRFVALR